MSREKYDLLQFTEEVVKKTLLVKEDRMFNLCHMALGFGSEYMSELLMAHINKSHSNKQEEIGDIEFFLVGWAIFEGLDYATPITANSYQQLIQPEVLLSKTLGDIQTVVKKELVSGVQKLDGKVLTKEDLQRMFEDAIVGIQGICRKECLLLETGIRPMIAKKLNVRYDGGGFDANKSIDRDTDAEAKAMSERV